MKIEELGKIALAVQWLAESEHLRSASRCPIEGDVRIMLTKEAHHAMFADEVCTLEAVPTGSTWRYHRHGKITWMALESFPLPSYAREVLA